ncbi:Z1 domain-containing protein [Paenisporosarcina sp. NPDC076898]|uniref:Z1 domain-containing protein n=1 Tax=unclassified Paenisporosarcina TaxID=2642018 RepID=UPI003D06642A
MKDNYFNMFHIQFNIFKSFAISKSDSELFEITCDYMDKYFTENIETKKVENWKLELQMKYVGVVYRHTSVVLRVGEKQRWYDVSSKKSRFYWVRYQQYLTKLKGWDQSTVSAIDETTDEILRSIGDPKSNEPFDFRGLVLGYVQSGKTANFTGLINKAYDEGYKLVIVLSGIHNDLRAQTQLRLEEEVLGKNNLGVGTILENSATKFIHSLTTVEADITGIKSNISYSLSGTRNLLVVKKNKDVLEHLKLLLSNLIGQANGQNIPTLIIDDEADQASIDTSDKKKGEDPKTINRLIREIVTLFDQKVYVGYTATPFANLLIGIDQEDSDAGIDLYPKDFLIGLPKPEDYCGPDEFFNTNEDSDDDRPSLIIDIGEEQKLFDDIKKKDQFDKVAVVPPKMREALFAFLITVAIRTLRGQINTHNSMLIHTSRFTSVQNTLKDVVEAEFSNIVNAVRYDPSSKYIKEIQKLYESEFVKKTNQWNSAVGSEYKIFEWESVFQQMKKSSRTIKVMEINGESNDALEYHNYKEKGLNVIAIGGDKLSRGLTLEGLTISYYYRNTLMYDTLMQMGRWFGYRKAYIDLCRIYTSNEIQSHFEHLAVAMKELRGEFDNLSEEILTPSDYAIRMMAHPKMMLTSALKMRNAIASYQNYSGKMHQTRLFSKEKIAYQTNMKVASNLINDIQSNILEVERKDKKEKGKTKYHVAEDVPVEAILTFLKDYYPYEKATKSSPQSMIEYINLLNKEHDRLSKWKVIIVEGIPNDGVQAQKVQLGALSLNYAVVRGQKSDGKSPNDRVDVKAIVAAGQTLFDETKGSKNVSIPKLFIYPLNPNTPVFESVQDVGFSEKLVPIGIAIAFPNESTEINNNIYMKNKSINETRGIR